MISGQFLQSLQSGDETAIESLVRSHQRTVFQIALSVLDDTRAAAVVAPEVLQEAEAATRETFLVALDRVNRYREDSSFEPWLYRIAVEVSRRRYRSWKIRRALAPIGQRVARLFSPPPPAEYQALGVSPVNIEAGETRLQPGDAELWQAVRGLPEKLRLAVVLRYYHELSIADIARVLRMSEGAVHARLDAARERVAKEIS